MPLIPEAGNEMLPLLMMAALEKQSHGYGGGRGGGFGPTNLSDGTPMSRRDVKENFHLRGLQRRAEMQGLSDALSQSRMRNVLGSMPAGSQQFAGDMAANPGLQTDLMQGLAAKSNAASFLTQLQGDQPVNPQVLRNQGLLEAHKAGTLAEDGAGSAGMTDQAYRDYMLNLRGAGADAGTTVNVGATPPQTIEQRAADAVRKAKGEKTEWEASPLGQGLKRERLFGGEYEPKPNLTVNDAMISLDERYGDQFAGRERDLPAITPEFIQSLRAQFPKSTLEAQGYDPGAEPSFLQMLGGPEYGQAAMNLILSNPDLTPEQLEAEMAALKAKHDKRFNWLPGMTGELSPLARPPVAPPVVPRKSIPYSPLGPSFE